MKRCSLISASLLALLLALPSTQVLAADLYRYTNDRGNTVIDYRIPPEYVKYGYEVLNDEGVVLRVVPPQATEEQRAAVDEELRQQAEAERLREWDESLLRRYSSVEDIEAARDRALGGLQIRVSTLKSNKRSLKQQVENYQSQAAEAQRRGDPVSADHLSAIEDLQSEIAATDRAIAERDKELKLVEDAYQRDIDRFAELEDMVEFRRKMANRNSSSAQAGGSGH